MKKEWAGVPSGAGVMLAVGSLSRLPKFGGAGHEQFQGT